MPNQLTNTGDGLALRDQTRPERRLVEEDADGDTSHRASVVAYGFDDAILVIDRDTDRVPMADRADLVALAATETESIHRGSTPGFSTPGTATASRCRRPGRGYRPATASRATPRRASLVMALLDSDAGTRRLLETRRTQALDTEADADD